MRIRTDSIPVIIPYLQDGQAHLFRTAILGIGIRDGSCCSVYCYVFDRIAVCRKFCTCAHIFQPGIRLLYSINIVRQIRNNSFQVRGNIRSCPIIRCVATCIEGLFSSVLQHNADPCIHIVGIQLHGHTGRTLMGCIVVIVPSFNNRCRHLFSGVGILNGN